VHVHYNALYKSTFYLLTYLLTYLLQQLVVIGGSDEVEYRLIRDLLRNYDHRIRPSLNASEPLNVTFGLALAQIIDVVRISLTCFYSAAALLAMQSAIFATAIVSVRLSVCHTLVPYRRIKIGSRGLHCEVSKTLYFPDTNSIWGRRPLLPKMCTRTDPPPLKCADFDKYLLITYELAKNFNYRE